MAAAAARRRNARSNSYGSRHSAMSQQPQHDDADHGQMSRTSSSQGGAVHATDSSRNPGVVKDRFGFDKTKRQPEFSDNPDRSHVQGMVSQVYQRLGDRRSKRSSVSQERADANRNSQSDRAVRRIQSHPSLRRVASARAAQAGLSDDRRGEHGLHSFYKLPPPPPRPEIRRSESR